MADAAGGDLVVRRSARGSGPSDWRGQSAARCSVGPTPRPPQRRFPPRRGRAGAQENGPVVINCQSGGRVVVVSPGTDEMGLGHACRGRQACPEDTIRGPLVNSAGRLLCRCVPTE